MAQEISTTNTPEEQQSPDCRHHWVIQPATGPVSQGNCQNCGEVREFKNYVEASTWGDDKGSSRSSSTGVTKLVNKKMDEETEE